MKRCPECRRDYYDDSLMYCLEDGTALVQGAVPTPDEPPTALLHETAAPKEAATQSQIHTVEGTVPRPSADVPVVKKFDKRLVLIPFAIVVIVLGGFVSLRYLSSPTQISSIAVMPFVNDSGNADLEYLSDGMTETLINNLSQIPKLSVKARSSVFHYKGRDIGPQQAGSELNVQTVLNGRVTQHSDSLTLSLELVDTRTGDQIWGEQYNKKLTDLVALQSEIARDVSSRLRARLSGADEQRVAKTYTANPEAYQLYLQGLYYWNKRTPEDIRKSIDLFQEATDKDPTYAQAYAGLALAYNVLATNSILTRQDKKELELKELAALERAQGLDDTLAEVHVELAGLKKAEWDFVASENEFRRAIELNPNFASAHQWYADLLASMGRHEEAVAETNKAHEIDPFSRTINTMIGMRSYEARRFDDAIAQYKKVIEMEPNYPNVHAFLASAYRAKGMYAEANSEGQVYARLESMPADMLELRHSALAEALKTGGSEGFERKLLELNQKDYEKGYATAFDVATIYARLGDKDHAFEWLEKSFADREDDLLSIKLESAFDGISSDRRFTDLLRRIGLPQ